MSETEVAEPPLQVVEETAEDAPYITYDIAAYPSDLTLTGIHQMWHDKDILVPDFQRNFVWTIRQSSLLIESFLMGLPVPQIFLYLDEDNRSVVIDGLQRIMSLVYYMDGFFGEENLHGKKQVFRLTGLSDKSPFKEKTFSSLDDAHQRKLKGSILRAINIRQMSPKDKPTSIYHIFERLNTGGTPLTPQEIRNCVFRGSLVEEFRRLNQLESWRQILGKATLDRHQKDVELILRIFALSTRLNEYEKPMKEFLNQAMSDERDADSPQSRRFISKFPEVCTTVLQVLGPKPFHLKGRLNASALDSVMATIFNHIDSLPDNLSERYAGLKVDHDFDQYTYYSTSDVSVLTSRFDLARKFLVL